MPNPMNETPLQQHPAHEEARRVLEDILRRMNIPATIEQTELLETPCFFVRSPDSGMLIGENGQHLHALYTIIRRITERRHRDECPPFLLDVNDYQKHRIEEIKERARMSAQRVRYFKKEVIMQPMSGYKRRIIHVTLAGDPDVATESIGEGENRRVVIKPVMERRT